MHWFATTFYGNPVLSCFLALAIYALWAFFYLPGKSREKEKAASDAGLKPVSLGEFAHYLNKTTCSCLQSRLDGSGFNSPVVEGILTGKSRDLIVTLFSLVLPTGRTGTRQTVVHLRSTAADWLPIFSVIDETCGKRVSDLLRCEHSADNPLMDPRCINRYDEADRIRAALARKPIPDTSLAGMKSPLRGVVVDSTGGDLFFYRHGETAEPFQYGEFIHRGITLREMINGGTVDSAVFEYTGRQQAMSLYLVAKGVLATCPGAAIIMLLGYGYVSTAGAFVMSCLAFFAYARFRLARSV